MDNQLLIARLKQNQIPFGLLSQEEQECLEKLNTTRDIECYQSDGTWYRSVYERLERYKSAVYRISPDYQPAPAKPMPAKWICDKYRVEEIEDISVLSFRQYGCVFNLAYTSNCLDFVGFVFAEKPDEIHNVAHLFLYGSTIIYKAVCQDDTPITAKWAIFKK